MKSFVTAIATVIAVLFLICFFGGAHQIFGQIAGSLLPDVIPVYPSLNGFGPAANGFLCTRVSGTTTLLGTYQNAALTVANQNPIRLNPSGRPVNGSAEVSVFLQQ